MSASHHVTASQTLTLGLFVCGLIVCIIGDFSLLWALGFGLVCFCGYAHHKGFSVGEILVLTGKGISRISSILTIFTLIGMLTGVWRLSGTIPLLIDYALSLIDPTFFLLWCFLLCAALSSLIGTAFGTVSTLGVICMIMAHTAGFSEIFTGGAILSGVYVGDRCSPMSSSAALVCALTHTDIYGNFKRMLYSGSVPFLLTCIGYAALSLLMPSHTMVNSTVSVLRENFTVNFWVLSPALVVLIFGILRIDVKKSMAVSILLAVAVSSIFQEADMTTILSSLMMGYNAPLPQLALLNGGGIASMINVIGIVALSSSYSAIFEKSGLLDSFEDLISVLASRIGAFRATTIVSLLATGLSCNQTLACILTHQLCAHTQSDRKELAMYLENSVILLSAVLPWSIAFTMCSLILQQSAVIIPCALYLWLVPLYWCLRSSHAKQSNTSFQLSLAKILHRD